MIVRQVRVPLPTGIVMNVAEVGPEDAPAALFVHGFPESHRTWRALVPLLADRVRMVMPDLRGFGQSDRPLDVAAYDTETLIGDLVALAEARRLTRYSLVGHDWGGALSWAMAIRGVPGLERLGIINSPHPAIFQRSLVEDAEQRAASQYMNAFRDPAIERRIEEMGYPAFFDKSFAPHVDLAKIDREERSHYLSNWRRPGAMTAMLNWYRAGRMHVPAPGEAADVPAWVAQTPKIRVPVRVLWGMKDKALLPIQLDGIEEVADEVRVVRLPDVGHFAPWEAPQQVADALRPFLVGE